MIKNFDKRRIVACSYDLRLGEIFKYKKTDKIIDISKQKPELTKLKLPYVLKPGEHIVGRTMEEIEMPMDLMGVCYPRGHAYRIGINVLASITPPGFKGQLVFSMQNISQNKIKIDRDFNLLQIAFYELKGDPIPFEATYTGGKLL